MARFRYDELTARGVRFLSGLLERVRLWLVQSRVRDLVLLALPYQVSAVLTALVAVGYTKLFHAMEDANLALLAYDPRLIFLSAPLSFLAAWFLVMRFAHWPAEAASPN